MGAVAKDTTTRTITFSKDIAIIKSHLIDGYCDIDNLEALFAEIINRA